MPDQRVTDEWGTVWTHGSAKTHLMPSCPYVGEKHHAIDTDDLPENRVDLCEWCEERYDAWRDGVDTDGTCQRCGEQIEDGCYCVACAEVVAARRARRQA
jgi:hypothetical protein